MVLQKKETRLTMIGNTFPYHRDHLVIIKVIET